MHARQRGMTLSTLLLAGMRLAHTGAHRRNAERIKLKAVPAHPERTHRTHTPKTGGQPKRSRARSEAEEHPRSKARGLGLPGARRDRTTDPLRGRGFRYAAPAAGPERQTGNPTRHTPRGGGRLKLIIYFDGFSKVEPETPLNRQRKVMQNAKRYTPREKARKREREKSTYGGSNHL